MRWDALDETALARAHPQQSAGQGRGSLRKPRPFRVAMVEDALMTAPFTAPR